MAVIFPVICFAVLSLRLHTGRPSSWTLSAVTAAVLMAFAVVLATGLLSAFKLLNHTALVAAWGLSAAAACWRIPLRTSAGHVSSYFLKKRYLTPLFVLMLAVIGVLVFLPVILTAFAAAPGTWDSMTYHLARVEHWVQDKSLVYYPTNIQRQLFYENGAEIFILHLRLLAGSDRFCNLPQLSAWFGCMAAAWAMLSLWKRTHWEKLIVVVLIATMPMAILQASSTQVDLTGSFWLMAFVYFLMEHIKGQRTFSLALCATALGLAVLTKGTNDVYAVPFVCWLLISECKHKGWKAGLRAAAILLAGVLSVNGWRYAAMLSFFHGHLPQVMENLANAHFNAATLMTNALRNALMHITTPFIPVNDRIFALLDHGARLAGINLQDASSMYSDKFTINALFLDEDYAQNPLHMLLLLALTGYAVFCRFWRRADWPSMAGLYVFSMVAAMMLFCLLVRWQPWNSRFQLGIFILGCVPAAVMLGRLSRRLQVAVMLIFIACSLLWAWGNDNRPMVGPASIWKTGRYQQYYRKQPMTAVHDKTASEIFQKISCGQVGLVLQENSWEYPFWVMMRQTGLGLRIEHVDVGNESRRLPYPLGDFQPCGVYMRPSDDRKMLEINDRFYARIWQTSLPDGSRSAVFVPVQ